MTPKRKAPTRAPRATVTGTLTPTSTTYINPVLALATGGNAGSGDTVDVWAVAS